MSDEKIFVSIVAKDDPQLVDTIKDALKKADNPERIIFGLCLQYESKPDLSFLSDRHRIIFQDLDTIYGVGYSRYLISNLIGSEEYFLQIDAHSNFDKGWDSLNINNFNNLASLVGSRKIVLSKYPETCSSSSGEFWRYHHDNGVESISKASSNEKFVRTHVAAGMYLFSESKFLIDLNYPSVFFHGGEEYSLGMQTYCLGYDIYAPKDSYCYHSPMPEQAGRDYKTLRANKKGRSPYLYDGTMQTRQLLTLLASRGFLYDSNGKIILDYRNMERDFSEFSSIIPPR